MQSILLFLISSPVYVLLLASTIEPEVSTADVAALIIELVLILIESIADQQQWSKN
jgi:Predicted membrane protein